jgi:hypothetical protein
VKVGNRQAPLQQTETPPRKGGVSAFTRPKNAQTALRHYPTATNLLSHH